MHQSSALPSTAQPYSAGGRARRQAAENRCKPQEVLICQLKSSFAIARQLATARCCGAAWVFAAGQRHRRRRPRVYVADRDVAGPINPSQAFSLMTAIWCKVLWLPSHYDFGRHISIPYKWTSCSLKVSDDRPSGHRDQGRSCRLTAGVGGRRSSPFHRPPSQHSNHYRRECGASVDVASSPTDLESGRRDDQPIVTCRHTCRLESSFQGVFESEHSISAEPRFSLPYRDLYSPSADLRRHTSSGEGPRSSLRAHRHPTSCHAASPERESEARP